MMQEMESSVALIVGVTGMAGLALAESLMKPTAAGGPWKVYGGARRPMPPWLDSSLLHRYITFDALDSQDTIQKLSPISHEVTHLFWVALQVDQSEQLNVTLNSTMLTNVLHLLKSASPSRLRHITLQTGTKHYMGPIFDPSLAGHLLRHDPPFREDSPRLPYPNFYYALEDLVASYASPSLAYSVHRSSIIVGASSRSVHNILFFLSVYASVCKHQGLPFRYPGNRYTWEHFCDMSDARVLAEQHIWAAVTEKAKNQAFNCSNGDVFTWKSLWRELCEVFEVEYVEFEESDEFDWVVMMKEKGQVWDEIVAKHGLYKTKLEEIRFEALTLLLHFEFEHVCSMSKSREFGFHMTVDTIKSMRMWVGRLRDMKIIP